MTGCRRVTPHHSRQGGRVKSVEPERAAVPIAYECDGDAAARHPPGGLRFRRRGSAPPPPAGTADTTTGRRRESRRPCYRYPFRFFSFAFFPPPPPPPSLFLPNPTARSRVAGLGALREWTVECSTRSGPDYRTFATERAALLCRCQRESQPRGFGWTSGSLFLRTFLARDTRSARIQAAMSAVARNRFLSALSVARRLAGAGDHAHVARMGVRRGNAACWRTLDCNARMVHSVTQPTWITSKDESRDLMAVWPDVVRDLTDAAKSFNIPDVTKWMAKVLQYNVPGGKKTRALALVYAYKVLAPSDQLTEENIRLVRILAWCVELMQAYLLIIDDIQDRSLLRRGQPCWYRYNDIGLAAIGDALMLESAMYYLIRKHFKGKDCYVNLLETFQDITFKTIMGQSLDMLSTNFGKKPNLDLFTMNRYNSIVEYKTAHYSFLLPITAAMQLAGIKDPEMFRQAKTILLEMGHLFQVQDDYLACFGDAEVCGKDNTDIQEGKCTWLVVVALQRATPEQRKILEECYGFSDPEKVNRVKQLFTDLGLPNTYSIYEEETYNLLNVHIQQISRGLPHNLFLNLLGKLYHRAS